MFIFLDTETTGNGPADRICQIAFKTEGGLTANELFSPGMTISIDAMTANHITNEMDRDKGSFCGSAVWNQLQNLIVPNSNVIVAHNVAFDVDMQKRRGSSLKTLSAPRSLPALSTKLA